MSIMPRKKKEDKRIDEQAGSRKDKVELPDNFKQVTSLGLGAIFDVATTGGTNTYVVPSSKDIKVDKLPDHK